MIADLTLAALPAAIWGNKVARLSSISSLGIAVPAGLCVTYATVRQSTNSVHEAIATWLTLYQPDQVAVRMSSVHEDQLDASRAGQTTSVLGCEPDASRLMHVLEGRILPYAAPWADRDGGLSFMFQCQVSAQFGGVAFLTGDRLVIEAQRQSTNAITSGNTPDVVVEMEGDNFEASGVLTGWPVMALAQFLGNICRNLQGHFGFDIDLEWAWHGGVVYVLQARPVTTSL